MSGEEVKNDRVVVAVNMQALNREERDDVASVATERMLDAHVGESCSICERTMALEDVRASVITGKRIAHKSCFTTLMPPEEAALKKKLVASGDLSSETFADDSDLEVAPEIVYWADGFIRDGVLAICPICKEVKEGTVGWHLRHERSCDFKPAGTWFKKRLENEIALVMQRIDAVMSPAMAKRILDAIWGGQWTTANAAANTYCAYECHEHDYADHVQHEPHCGFVTFWRDLDVLRQRVGDSRVAVVRGAQGGRP